MGTLGSIISSLMPTRCLPAIRHSFSAQNVLAVITSLIRVMMAHCSPTMMDQILLLAFLPLSRTLQISSPPVLRPRRMHKKLPSPRDHQMSPWSKVAGGGGGWPDVAPIHTHATITTSSWALSHTPLIQGADKHRKSHYSLSVGYLSGRP